MTGLLPCVSGTIELPSTKAGGVTPAQSAKVGARSMFATMWSSSTPGCTSGPQTTSGTMVSVS